MPAYDQGEWFPCCVCEDIQVNITNDTTWVCHGCWRPVCKTCISDKELRRSHEAMDELAKIGV
jgi:hypothetical protein